MPLAGPTRALSFLPFPAGTSSNTAAELDTTDAAVRDSFWLSTSYVLASALSRAFAGSKEHVLLYARADTLANASGGAGCSYDVAIHSAQLDVPQSASSLQDRARRILEVVVQSSAPSQEQLQRVERVFADLVKADLPIDVELRSAGEAAEHFAQQPLKAETLSALDPQTKVGLVRVGDHLDLLLPDSEGRLAPLLPTTGYFGGFKIQQWSRSSWLPSKADDAALTSTSQPLIRIRAVSFPNAAQLKSHLAAQELALAADHRTVGKAQSLFMTHDQASPGSPFILPHGMRIGRKVERVIRDLYDVYGYDEVHSPQLFKKDLWVRSGHWDNYRDDMFKVQGFKEDAAWLLSRQKHDGHTCAGIGKDEGEDSETFGLKPMNCPGHCLIFSSKERSYRDLPLRLAEFGPLHRNEASGSLSGLTRVRRFHQDDAHVFCAPGDISSEISTMLKMLTSAYRSFGFEKIEMVLSSRPAQYIGELAEWDKAEEALRTALDANGRSWSLNEGDGAFYGPKIDCRLVDAAGRKHQTATIQLDFQLPRRFDLKYADPHAQDGSGYSRPVMIHRAILGSVERFMAILIESNGGRWPFWISPRQAVVLPVAETPEISAFATYARDYIALGETIADWKRDSAPESTVPPRPQQVFHADLYNKGGTLSKMVRTAQSARYNFMLVVGEKEAQNGTVSVRVREDYVSMDAKERPTLHKDMGEMPLKEVRALFSQLDSNHW